MKGIFLLGTFLVISVLILDYSIGKTSFDTTTTSQKPAFSSKIIKKQDLSEQNLLEEQKDTNNIEQQQINLPEENQNSQKKQTAIIKEKAIEIVESDYQSDGHIVVMSEDDKSYTIGCFWEMYFDEHTGKPHYNMQAAEYIVDKYSGKILSVSHKNNNTTAQQNNMNEYYYERYWEIEAKVENIYDDLYITSDLITVSENELAEWDALLNEVYNYIKGTISSTEFAKLQESERNWIKQRDANAENAANFDGSMVELEYNGSLITQTKERILWLIDNYI